MIDSPSVDECHCEDNWRLETRPGYEDPTEAGSFDRFEFMTMPRRVGTFATITFDGSPVTFQYQTTTQHRSHVGEGAVSVDRLRG